MRSLLSVFGKIVTDLMLARCSQKSTGRWRSTVPLAAAGGGAAGL